MRTLIINKDWPKVSVLYTDPTLIIKNLCREFSSDIACDYVENDFEDILMILQPAVCMTADTIRDFISAGIPAKLKSGNDTVAIFMPLSYHSRIDIHDIDEEQLKTFYLPAEESFCATDAMNTYLCNETLRNRINEQLLNKGVYIADVATAFIAPFVQIEEGATILPNCQIYGLSTIKKGAVIGPNAVISDSCIGENTKINASQVFESSVGCDTTVGPFAYIRPKSDIGDNVKIGDYVEIKKSTIGNGTKISHFAYIGDSEIGSKVNFSWSHNRQLRRQEQVQDQGGRQLLYRLQCQPCGARGDRRRSLCGCRLDSHGKCSAGRSYGGSLETVYKSGLGKKTPRRRQTLINKKS